ncbi:MAG TPA: L-2-hydroxyglutarate oxidase [Ignavibacteriaceae bacterium]|nr:L-2-hydroxyglutarate oxidase [Ignavibacteriaceae bacterium]
MKNSADIIIIGGGIVGMATAMILKEKGTRSITVIEAENEIAAHQTGHNSGVIHSGLYYKPGSLKAKNCVMGRERLYRFCEENNIEHEHCGKVVIATDESEISTLMMLEERGTANELKGIKRLRGDEIKEYEPHASGIAGLFVPETGIVNYTPVTNKYAELFRNKGGKIITNCRFLSLEQKTDQLILQTTKGGLECRLLVNCGGLYSDRIAKKCGVEPGLRIVPFRGEYYKLKKEKEYLVNNLIYPVPDPRFPFLGVHFTRMIKGGVEAGPNAVLAFKREGYSRNDISLKDLSQMMMFTGFWKMAAKYYKMGFAEFYRSFSKNAFVRSLQKLIPEITEDCIEPGGSGVRAQALERDGKFTDDFRIIESRRMIHVLNAPSPAATASLSIGDKISELILRRLN